MKRFGHIYEQMSQWHNIVEAERIATKRKASKKCVRNYLSSRINNLVNIQNMVLEGRMKTDEYTHKSIVSGQDKVRDISKLPFYPSHIEHQLLTIVSDRRIDKNLIRNTYSCRVGYGQIACANKIKRNLAKYIGQERWYGQGDMTKYYKSIRHENIEERLRHIFKDEKFIKAMLEPFARFSDNGVSIPLGIRPSQSIGNLYLSPFDHFMLEENKCADYVRYLDDFVFTGATKGEVKRKMKRANVFIQKMGLTMHEPKIHRVSEGLDMMGFVFYGRKNDMWWRKSNKRRWLKHRARVRNQKRLQELDNAAWGMLKWGNRHCKRLWVKKTKKSLENKKMANFSKCNIKRTERVDENGNPFFEAPRISMPLLLGKPVEVDLWIPNVKTSQGEGRYVLRIHFMGGVYKLIVNSSEIKNFLSDMTRNHVTRFSTTFIDRSSKHYGIDETTTDIIEVNGRKVTERDGKIVFEDNGDTVHFS